jgi:hypothetical protein
MRHALRRKYGRFLFSGHAGQRRQYKGWTIVALGRGEFDLLKGGRRRGFAMSWADAKAFVDEHEAGHMHGEEHSGTRDIDEMVRAAAAPTIVPPPSTKTMWGQIEYDRKLREARRRKR